MTAVGTAARPQLQQLQQQPRQRWWCGWATLRGRVSTAAAAPASQHRRSGHPQRAVHAAPGGHPQPQGRWRPRGCAVARATSGRGSLAGACCCRDRACSGQPSDPSPSPDCMRASTQRRTRQRRWTCMRRGRMVAACSGSEDAGGSPLLVSNDAVAEMMRGIAEEGDERRLDVLLQYVPDSLLDKAIAAKKKDGASGGDVRFSDMLSLLRAGDFGASAEMLFDSFAMRLLVYGTPAAGATAPLSSLMAAPGRAVHRMRVQAGAEAAVLTVTMQLQEGLQPQYRMAPQIFKVWRLKSITGEPDDPDVPSAPRPGVSPEAVVAAQLSALQREDVAAVFSFASPSNRAATGPLERFGSMLQSPMYRPLLGHGKAESLRRIQLTPETYAEVVGVVSDNTGMGRESKFVYVWSVGRVLPEQSEEQAGLWMTNNVQLVTAGGGAVPWAEGT